MNFEDKFEPKRPLTELEAMIISEYSKLKQLMLSAFAQDPTLAPLVDSVKEMGEKLYLQYGKEQRKDQSSISRTKWEEKGKYRDEYACIESAFLEYARSYKNNGFNVAVIRLSSKSATLEELSNCSKWVWFNSRESDAVFYHGQQKRSGLAMYDIAVFYPENEEDTKTAAEKLYSRINSILGPEVSVSIGIAQYAVNDRYSPKQHLEMLINNCAKAIESGARHRVGVFSYDEAT